jgi:hypothetical protein
MKPPSKHVGKILLTSLGGGDSHRLAPETSQVDVGVDVYMVGNKTIFNNQPNKKKLCKPTRDNKRKH